MVVVAASSSGIIPHAVIVWLRDGVSEFVGSFSTDQELVELQSHFGLIEQEGNQIPIAFMACQRPIETNHYCGDGTAAWPGALVSGTTHPSVTSINWV
jgi:hypothetical protein